jgi:hypothetical protein
MFVVCGFKKVFNGSLKTGYTNWFTKNWYAYSASGNNASYTIYVSGLNDIMNVHQFL